MDELPLDLCSRIFSMLDYRHLASAALVCRTWSSQSGQAHLWQRLYEERWGKETLNHSKFTSWKAAYEAQDRCERIGMDITITREGIDYWLVREGRLLRLIGSAKTQKKKLGEMLCNSDEDQMTQMPTTSILQKRSHASQEGLVNKLFFFLGDLECATRKAKRNCVM